MNASELKIPPVANTAPEMTATLVGNRASAPAEGSLVWIDVLRGLAAMWVIIYHSRIDLWVGLREIQKNPGAFTALDRMVAWLSLPAAFGGSAVMLFFVISGFCIHFPYAAGNRPFCFRHYAVRRALRILPPYLFAVMLTCLLEWLTNAAGGPTPTPWSEVARVALLSQNYGADPHQLFTNGALWSLPVEVELYVAYLIFYVLLRRSGASVVAIIVAGASLAATVAYVRGMAELGGNFIHYWAIWCAGALLAERFRNPHTQIPPFRHWNALTGCLFGIWAVWGDLHHWPLGILQYLWAALYFHIVWLVLYHPRLIYALPYHRVETLKWFGKISYSAYLIHYPLFAACGFAWERFFGGKPASFLVPLGFSIGVWPVAWIFWRFCEYPFHQLSQSIGKRPLLVASPCANFQLNAN
jgi:peptidoglycan/LPS O-acetylase OafA/YrhL